MAPIINATRSARRRAQVLGITSAKMTTMTPTITVGVDDAGGAEHSRQHRRGERSGQDVDDAVAPAGRRSRLRPCGRGRPFTRAARFVALLGQGGACAAARLRWIAVFSR